MWTEEEKTQMAEVQKKMDKAKAERKFKNTKHIERLKALCGLEDVVTYWNENCTDSSFLYGVFGNDVSYKVEEVFKDRDARLKILEAEMKRIDNKYLNDLLSTRIENKFNLRIRTDSNSYKLAKKGAFEAIKRLIDTKTYKDLPTKHRSKGFNAYKGGIGYEVAVSDLKILSIGIINRRGFKSIYEGYLLAQLKEKLKNYSKDGAKLLEPLNRIEVRVSMPVFAAIIYKFALVGEMFPLCYKSNRDYNASATADYYRKRFKVLKNDGKEVSIAQFKKCFKESEMDLVDNDILKALDKFPFKKIE